MNISLRQLYDIFISFFSKLMAFVGIIIGIFITIAIYQAFGPIACLIWIIFGLIFGYLTRER